MAHDVRVKINTAIEVANKDVEVLVRSGRGKLGMLLISRGNIEWFPGGNSVNKQRLSWQRFAEFMKEHGTRVKAR